jgi:putative transposase
MNPSREKPRRRSIRLRAYDYTQAGAYFITIVAHNRAMLFSDIAGGESRLNDFGRIVEEVWTNLPKHYSGVQCDAFIIMPNHIHGIITLKESDVGAGFKPALHISIVEQRAGLNPAPTRRHGLPEMVRGLKTFSARGINERRHTPGAPVWQRNYYEHVIRDDGELLRVREYIMNNPLEWETDRENPSRPANWKPTRMLEAWQV